MNHSSFSSFLAEHLNKVEPLSRDVNLAYWRASISGRAEDFERSAELQIQLQRYYADKGHFELIRQWKLDGAGADAIEARQIDMLHNAFLRNQIDPDLNEVITKLASRIENQFNIHRACIDGKTVTSNDILSILKESDDSELRRKAWESGKEVGGVVEDDLLKLVRLRNEAADALGYSNYYTMALDLSEQNEAEVLALFDELEEETREPFLTMKHEVDERLAERCGISVEQLRPWHYEDPFFQEAPQVFDVNLDDYYKSVPIVERIGGFFRSIGLDADDILARSDLYEKPGKDQHAFCTDIDRSGDIRVLTNIKSDETWAGTLLHELGHAVHDKFIDTSLPYLLRQEAHIFTTEAIAMLFGRLSKNAAWMEQFVGLSAQESKRIAPTLDKSLRLQQLVFARWSQVMLRFERELYLDPEQDLTELWWQLIEKHQNLTRPDDVSRPHWAAKTHIVSVPVYYHNYLLGELLASQLTHCIRSNVLGNDEPYGALDGKTGVGDYLKEKVFKLGARYRWDDLVTHATGEGLTPRYFTAEFVS